MHESIEIASGGHGGAEANQILFLMCHWESIAEKVKGPVLMIPEGIQGFRAAGLTSEDELFQSCSTTVIAYPHRTSQEGRAGLLGGPWLLALVHGSCTRVQPKSSWNEGLHSWCPELAALSFPFLFLKSHKEKKFFVSPRNVSPLIKDFKFSHSGGSPSPSKCFPLWRAYGRIATEIHEALH